MKEQALAAFRRDNPGRPEFANSQGSQTILQERQVGQVNTIFQPVASNPAINVPACGCEEKTVLCPRQFILTWLTREGTPIPPFTFRDVYSFTPTTNNGTLTFSISPSQPFLATIISPGTLAFDTDSTDIYTAIMTYTVPGCAPVSAQSAPCFLAGAQVALADGTSKNIEDVVIGDKVVGAFGEVNEVLALHRPRLGLAQMMTINGEHSTTAHHPHVGVDRKFYCWDVERVSASTYGREHTVIGPDGPESRFLHGLIADRIYQLGHGTMLQTLNGGVPVADMEFMAMPADTQLYNLVVGGSHTYTVDTYAVTGWPREDDFDYDTWKPKTRS